VGRGLLHRCSLYCRGWQSCCFAGGFSLAFICPTKGFVSICASWWWEWVPVRVPHLGWWKDIGKCTKPD
jgi:hypothetical protein